MIMYKRNFDGNRSIYFLMKDKKVFIRYMEVLEKVSNIIKSKFNNELLYSKKHLKPKKKINAKGGFQCLYATIILIDSIYRKDENCHPKAFLEI